MAKLRHISYAGSLIAFLSTAFVLYTGYLAIQAYFYIIAWICFASISVFLPVVFYIKAHAMWVHDHALPLQEVAPVKRIQRKKEG